jgi:hypothetical protein
MALPSIATVLKWDLPQTNVVLSEEEKHASSGTFVVNEKALPKVLNVHDFLKFFETTLQGEKFSITDDSSHCSPYLSIFSPPPEA